MSYRVPEFEMNDDFPNPPPCSSASLEHRGKEDIMELLWQNGQVVFHPQQHKAQPPERPPPSHPNTQPQSQTQSQQQRLFMDEDEMTSWLHYPLEDFYPDLMYPAPSAAAPSPPPARPPVPATAPVTEARNFPLFSRITPGRVAEPSPSKADRTVVGSNVSPGVAVTAGAGTAAAGGGEGKSEEREEREMTMTSASSGAGSGAPAAATPAAGAGSREATRREEEEERKVEVAAERKRKEREKQNDEAAAAAATATASHSQTQNAGLESADEKKLTRVSTSIKRARAAEVHNLSERKRRDRINERMRALQELIPRCNKSDKASMLDEAIEYLKSLQMQIQRFSLSFCLFIVDGIAWSGPRSKIFQTRPPHINKNTIRDVVHGMWCCSNGVSWDATTILVANGDGNGDGNGNGDGH